jgi:predicted transcriptional regulator
MLSMTIPERYPASNGLALLLGPRQADIMAILWNYGPATAREVHARLAKDTALAYTTITTICARLAELGLLRQQVEPREGRSPHTFPYRYTPAMSEAEFVRLEIGQQLDQLLVHYPTLIREHVAQYGKPHGAPEAAEAHEGTDVGAILTSLASLRDAAGQPVAPTVLDTIAALVERTERAEHQSRVWETEANHARQQAHAAASRADVAEREAEEWKAEAHRAHQRALLAEEETAAALRRVQMQHYAKAEAVVEHYDPSGICRVCRRPAPYIPTRRRDGLRICDNPSCKQEAHRRDNLAKQRQFRERQRLQRAQRGTTA